MLPEDEDDELPAGQDDGPITEPKSAKGWLSAIEQSEKSFRDYHDRCDKISKLYADMARLATDQRDREFQMFWANVEVLRPAIYSRPPVPVVVPRFKDRKPVPRKASELLERSTVVAFDLDDIDGTMKLVRDDLVLTARGAPWVRYETKAESDSETERCCVEHVDRKDFLHELARKWPDVGWVAKRSWLTKREMRKRFRKTSGDAYLNCEYIIQKEDKANAAADRAAKAGVWELWSKTHNKVVWVAPGCDKLLDEGKPHLKLEGFFPCPKPAYATVQPRSLMPVPDVLFYKDQLEEINELTGRISALTGAIKVRGFYPAGSGEVGDAIERALKSLDDRQVMVGVSNWAAFGAGAAKDTIVWLPIDMIITTVAALIEQRRQIIDDVYQITGLSDIMRGATDPNETLGAQQLKSQYGSIRIRERQAELVRVARDVVRIVAEIMSENFRKETLLDMSQMDIPTDADIAKQVREIEKQADEVEKGVRRQVEQAQANPQFQQMVEQDPEQAQQMRDQLMQQAQEQLQGLQKQAEKIGKTVTIDQIMKLLREQRIRPFVLDIETDSTIQPDEDAEKQRRSEFLGMLGTLLPQLGQMVQTMPGSEVLAGEVLKFGLGPFRAGRELEGAVDEFVEQMKNRAGQPQPNPEAEAAKAQQEIEQQKLASEQQRTQAETQMKAAEIQAKMQIEVMKAQTERENAAFERESKQQENNAKLQQISAQMQRDEQKGELEIQKLQMDLVARREELELKRQSAEIDAAAKVQQADIAAQSAQQQAGIQAETAEREAEQSERSFEQQTALNAQQARQKAIQQSEGPR